MSIIKSFSVGNGDMFYIEHDTDNFTVIDCFLENEKSRIIKEIREKSKKKGVTRFISTHPDEDHIRGIEDFDNKIGINNFYCVKNQIQKKKESPSFKKYCELRDSDRAYYIKRNCSRKWLNERNGERGSSGINILWPNIENKNYKEILKKASEKKDVCNNLSPIFEYSLKDGVKVMWMGDIETTFLEKIKNDINWKEVDIVFAPHHGRYSGRIPEEILKKLKPKVIVIGKAPSEYLNYYKNYNTITQNSAGDITFECLGLIVNVYVSNEGYNVGFLDDKDKDKKLDLGYYIGSFKVEQGVN